MMEERTYQGEYAGCMSRLIAFLIDTALIAIVVGVSAWMFNLLFQGMGVDPDNCAVSGSGAAVRFWMCHVGRWAKLIILALIPVLYYGVSWTLAGQSIGKGLVGVRIVQTDGRPLSFLRSVWRYVAYAFSFAPLGLGFLWIAIDDRRQGFHDKLARTYVIYAWPAVQNERLLRRLQRRLKRRSG
ncbi:MAG: RDD family protein [Chloroflexi bacterium]|nr:RDD family protein [Chloroflexota bacterium]